MDMNTPTSYQTVEIKEERNSKLVGILFCHPESKMAKEEIIGYLPYFHLRSGEAVDFFCVGYGAYWPKDHYADQKSVVKIKETDWLFSEQAFSDVIDDLELNSQWKYSGETDLILVSAEKSVEGKTQLNFKTAIVCNLEAMEKDKAFSSVRSFFTDLFRSAKKFSDQNEAWALSDAQGVNVAKNTIKGAVLSILPINLRENYKKAEHYAVKNIA